MATIDLCGTAVARLVTGPTVLASSVIDLKGYAANQVWNIFKIPAGAKCIGASVKIIEQSSAACTFDVGFASSDEFLNGTDVNVAAGFVITVAGTAPTTQVAADTMVTAIMKTGVAQTAGKIQIFLTFART